MKLFLLLSIIFVISCSKASARKGKIASGHPLEKGQFLDFCYITVNFFQKQKTCGCVIFDKDYVLTTATCVYDCSEKLATNITVKFPQKPPKDATVSVDVQNIVFPPEFIASNYQPDDASRINFAKLKLSKSIVIDGKTASSSLEDPKTLSDNYKIVLKLFLSKSPSLKFMTCGVGIINNKREKAKGVSYTEVKIVRDYNCKVPGTEILFNLLYYACIQSYRDINVCAGDFGGPIYAKFKTSPEAPEVVTPVGLAAMSPDLRPSAPCLDGHTVFMADFYYLPRNNFGWPDGRKI